MKSSDKALAIFAVCAYLGVCGALIVGWPAVVVAGGVICLILRKRGDGNG